MTKMAPPQLVNKEEEAANRYRPSISASDPDFTAMRDKFKQMRSGKSFMSLDDILDKHFTAHEKELFLPVGPDISPARAQIQRNNTRDYYRLLKTSRFESMPINSSAETLATKLTMLYFGLPVEPYTILTTDHVPLIEDSDEEDVVEEVVGQLVPEEERPLRWLNQYDDRLYGKDLPRMPKPEFELYYPGQMEIRHLPGHTDGSLRGGAGHPGELDAVEMSVDGSGDDDYEEDTRRGPTLVPSKTTVACYPGTQKPCWRLLGRQGQVLFSDLESFGDAVDRLLGFEQRGGHTAILYQLDRDLHRISMKQFQTGTPSEQRTFAFATENQQMTDPSLIFFLATATNPAPRNVEWTPAPNDPKIVTVWGNEDAREQGECAYIYLPFFNREMIGVNECSHVFKSIARLLSASPRSAFAPGVANALVGFTEPNPVRYSPCSSYGALSVSRDTLEHLKKLANKESPTDLAMTESEDTWPGHWGIFMPGVTFSTRLHKPFGLKYYTRDPESNLKPDDACMYYQTDADFGMGVAGKSLRRILETRLMLHEISLLSHVDVWPRGSDILDPKSEPFKFHPCLPDGKYEFDTRLEQTLNEASNAHRKQYHLQGNDSFPRFFSARPTYSQYTFVMRDEDGRMGIPHGGESLQSGFICPKQQITLNRFRRLVERNLKCADDLDPNHPTILIEQERQFRKPLSELPENERLHIARVAKNLNMDPEKYFNKQNELMGAGRNYFIVQTHTTETEWTHLFRQITSPILFVSMIQCTDYGIAVEHEETPFGYHKQTQTPTAIPRPEEAVEIDKIPRERRARASVANAAAPGGQGTPVTTPAAQEQQTNTIGGPTLPSKPASEATAAVPREPASSTPTPRNDKGKGVAHPLNQTIGTASAMSPPTAGGPFSQTFTEKDKGVVHPVNQTPGTASAMLTPAAGGPFDQASSARLFGRSSTDNGEEAARPAVNPADTSATGPGIPYNPPRFLGKFPLTHAERVKMLRESTWGDCISIFSGGRPHIPIHGTPIETFIHPGTGLPSVSRGVLTPSEQFQLELSVRELRDMALDRKQACMWPGCGVMLPLDDKEVIEKHINLTHVADKCNFCPELLYKYWSIDQRNRHFRDKHAGMFTTVTDLNVDAEACRVLSLGRCSSAERHFLFCPRCGRDHRSLYNEYDRVKHDNECYYTARTEAKVSFCKGCGEREDSTTDAHFHGMGCGTSGKTRKDRSRFPHCVKCGLATGLYSDHYQRKHLDMCKHLGQGRTKYCPWCGLRVPGRRQDAQYHLRLCDAIIDKTLLEPYELNYREVLEEVYPEEAANAAAAATAATAAAGSSKAAPAARLAPLAGSVEPSTTAGASKTAGPSIVAEPSSTAQPSTVPAGSSKTPQPTKTAGPPKAGAPSQTAPRAGPETAVVSETHAASPADEDVIMAEPGPEEQTGRTPGSSTKKRKPRQKMGEKDSAYRDEGDFDETSSEEQETTAAKSPEKTGGAPGTSAKKRETRHKMGEKDSTYRDEGEETSSEGTEEEAAATPQKAPERATIAVADGTPSSSSAKKRKPRHKMGEKDSAYRDKGDFDETSGEEEEEGTIQKTAQQATATAAAGTPSSTKKRRHQHKMGEKDSTYRDRADSEETSNEPEAQAAPKAVEVTKKPAAVKATNDSGAIKKPPTKGHKASAVPKTPETPKASSSAPKAPATAPKASAVPKPSEAPEASEAIKSVETELGPRAAKKTKRARNDVFLPGAEIESDEEEDENEDRDDSWIIDDDGSGYKKRHGEPLPADSENDPSWQPGGEAEDDDDEALQASVVPEEEDDSNYSSTSGGDSTSEEDDAAYDPEADLVEASGDKVTTSPVKNKRKRAAGAAEPDEDVVINISVLPEALKGVDAAPQTPAAKRRAVRNETPRRSPRATTRAAKK